MFNQLNVLGLLAFAGLVVAESHTIAFHVRPSLRLDYLGRGWPSKSNTWFRITVASTSSLFFALTLSLVCFG